MIPMIQDSVAIAIGAICGAITRYQTGRVVTEYITQYIHPNDITKQSYYLGWHTAFINISGSFLLGIIFASPTIETTTTNITQPSILPNTNHTASTVSSKVTTNHSSTNNTNSMKTTISSVLHHTEQQQINQHRTHTTPVLPTTTAVPTPILKTTARTATTSSTTNTGPLISFGLSSRSKLLAGVGFCGSYTTFSTFSVDVVSWLMQGQVHKAVSYLAINNLGGITAAACGMILMKKICGTSK